MGAARLSTSKKPDKLVNHLEALKKSAVADIIRHRIKRFSSFRKKPSKELFKELCFCLLTANYSAEGAIRIQQKLGDGFSSLPCRKLARELKKLHYRFPNTRARYICGARAHGGFLKKIFGFPSGKDAREWLVKNIKGLGYKEASHFLRNVGFIDVAIIDFHIIDLLVREGEIRKPRSLTRGRYLAIERKLETIARETGLNLAELDLYLWYMETGKVLK